MKKHHTLDMDHNWKQTEIKFTSKPKQYDPTYINNYIAERERFINDDLSKQWLKEHGYETS